MESRLSGESSGHDWWHIDRVWRMAIRIAEAEKADRTVVELAALLHDIADWKLHNGDETAGLHQAETFLGRTGIDADTRAHVLDILSNLSFKGAGVATPMKTLEGCVVQDADRLDALGALGIARAFAYGGNKNRLIHHPNQQPVLHRNFEEYKSSRGPTINHFFEKLLLLKDRMNTATAKQIAEDRHRFLEQYLNRFFKEWDGIL